MEFGVIHVVVLFLILVVFALVKKWFEEYQARMEAVQARMEEYQARMEEAVQARMEAVQAQMETVQRCLRSEFREKANTFLERKHMLDYIESANFPDANAKADLSDQGTADFLSDHSSATSVEGVIKLSDFRRSKILNAKPAVMAYHFGTGAEAIRNIVLQKMFSNKKEV
jgi:uncharacterized membrane-anchored protein YhcB (DUF1043 family)